MKLTKEQMGLLEVAHLSISKIPKTCGELNQMIWKAYSVGLENRLSPPNDSTAVCEWTELLDGYGKKDGYETNCDCYFIAIPGKYCPDCGKPIKDVSRAEV